MAPKQSSLFAHQPPKVIFRLALNRSYTGKRNSLNEPCISEFRGHPSFHGYKLIVVELPPLNRMPLIGSPSCQVSPMPLHTPSPFSTPQWREVRYLLENTRQWPSSKWTDFIRKGVKGWFTTTVTPFTACLSSYLVCPIRCALAAACKSFWGLKSLSTNITVSADIRFKPWPPWWKIRD